MKNAGSAMKQIHGNLTIDKVDATMDELREQHALGEEIASAITNAPLGEPLDEADLEEELEGMEQEAMDERMLKTGTLPVQGLPAVGNQPREFHVLPFLNLRTKPDTNADNMNSERKTRRRRRRRRAAETTSRNGHVELLSPRFVFICSSCCSTIPQYIIQVQVERSIPINQSHSNTPLRLSFPGSFAVANYHLTLSI